jgi:hypothetical protein
MHIVDLGMERARRMAKERYTGVDEAKQWHDSNALMHVVSISLLYKKVVNCPRK